MYYYCGRRLRQPFPSRNYQCAKTSIQPALLVDLSRPAETKCPHHVKKPDWVVRHTCIYVCMCGHRQAAIDSHSFASADIDSGSRNSDGATVLVSLWVGGRDDSREGTLDHSEVKKVGFPSNVR
eukprot:GHVU01194632.1.p2 GENE.GHVU01194632.1~~GHVU01194632.1.p2  ORF type:complete len:124 (+),score=16.34 GHVU01194632.1:208-579(+)